MNLKALSLASAIVLFATSPMLGQQKKEATTAPKSFAPDEPQSCVEFDRMAARLNAVNKTEEISKTEYDEGVKKYRDGTQVEGVDYFIVTEDQMDKYQRISLQRDKRAEFIRWYAVEGGRGQMGTANMKCTSELFKGYGTHDRDLRALRQLQNTVIVSQAEGLLADVALEGQNFVIRALLESEAERRKVIDRYNALVKNLDGYNEAVNNLVAAVNTIVNERKTSKPAPAFNFNFIRPQPITCTGSTFAYSNSTAYLVNVDTITNASTTIRCQ